MLPSEPKASSAANAALADTAPSALLPLRPGALLHLLHRKPTPKPSSNQTDVTAPLQKMTLRPGALAHLSKLAATPAPVITTDQSPHQAHTPEFAQGQTNLFSAPPKAPSKAPSKTSADRTPKRRSTQPATVDLCEKTLTNLALSSPSLALLCAPTGFMDCTQAQTSLANIEPETNALLYLRKTGRVWGYDSQRQEVQPHPFTSLYEAPWPSHWKHIHQLRMELEDEQGNRVYVTHFGAGKFRNQDPFAMVLLHGILKSFGPKTFIDKAEHIPAQAFGKVYPRYSSPGGTVNEAGVRAIVTQALNTDGAEHACTTELIRQTLLSEAQMTQIAALAANKHQENNEYAGPIAPPNNIPELLSWMHEPPSLQHGQVAVACARAIAVEGICHAARRRNERPPHPRSPIALTPAIINQVIQSQPEQLTSDQQDAIRAICTALQRPTPLTGLLSGDVGTGKTLTFAIPVVATHLAQGKACILAPTEILANQAYEGLRRRFPFARIERVLTGKKIQDPGAILVGTAGLCTVAKKIDYHPDVLVIDEQHKLSTEIRTALCQPWTHVIEASATPIPRSLASSLFAGMDVFTLAKAPVVRCIESHLIGENDRGIITKQLRKVLASGGRAAFIYPRVTAGTADQNSVLQASQTLSEHFPNKVCTLHGKMKTQELQEALECFRAGTTPIVVSSTVMETGIDVADIRLLVVRDADNFGAAQLHQLRGRLARNGGDADFFMLIKNLAETSEDTLERLEMVRDTTDGYALSEADMRQRGFGNLNGDAQSGSTLSPIRLLNLTIEDFDGSTT